MPALAAQNPDDKALVAKVLDRTTRNCQRASKIMASLLGMANGQRQQQEEVSVKVLVDEVFTGLCRDFAKDSIRVEITVPDDLRLYCVPVQIQQVLMNLVLNARDAMLGHGGTLRVEASGMDHCVEIAVQRQRRRHQSGEPQEHLPAVLHHESRKGPPPGRRLRRGAGVLPTHRRNARRQDRSRVATQQGKHIPGPTAHELGGGIDDSAGVREPRPRPGDAPPARLFRLLRRVGNRFLQSDTPANQAG